MKKYIYTLILLVLPTILFAQNDKLQNKNLFSADDKLEIPAELKSRVQDFFVNLSNEKIETAFSKLLLDSPMIQNEEQTKSLISETYRAIKYYGKNHGYESVDKQQPTKSIIRVRYIGIHENYPVRWVFTFYRSPTLGWIVTNVKFDDLSQYYFDEMIK